MIAQNLFDALGGAPSLPGAKCRGRHRLFDPKAEFDPEPPEHTEQRHRQALALCAECPALARCADWVDSLPRSKRPSGVVGGRVNNSKPRMPSKTISVTARIEKGTKL